jgi:gliding motility-associated-like protein
VSNDCETVERSLTVRLDESGPAPLLYMPNSFSPNGDLINDCYQGFLSPRLDLQFFVLKIFDRWGNMMFQTNDPASCWDGNRKGKALDPAVFVWFVEMHIRDCEGAVLEIFREGDLHLLR